MRRCGAAHRVRINQINEPSFRRGRPLAGARCIWEYHMEIRIIIGFLLAFVIALVLGKLLIPWLNRRRMTQPLKEEVAQIYDEKDDNE